MTPDDDTPANTAGVHLPTETVVAWEDADGDQHRETLAPGESRAFSGDLVSFVTVERRGREAK